MAFLDVCELTMIRWRKGLHGGGPPCVKVGRDFYYPRQHLERFKIQRAAEKAKRTARAARRNKFQEMLRAALQAQAQR